MSTSQPQNTDSNVPDVPPDPIADKAPGIKPVDIDAPYEHAPPKDSDPWTTLLTPELDADTLRCKAWNDEVQNLLIFAGLFSAVVTAFVIESYKFLQPDPNDAITGLLFHIATGLNNTSPFPPSVSPESILTPFSQTPSAIRINVFWFISLILSLTTVLVGTIALQWLRAHQSYDDYSSKEKLAMLHMRLQAIDAWYLPQVFAALPLLLQAALVLFLAGLIDFSSLLGLKVTIPVSIAVGMTLLFLASTTILPSLQGISFFFGLYPRKTLPTPCPFKSPQSHAFRMLFGIVLRAIFHVFPSPSLDYAPSSPNMNDWKWVIKNRSLLIADHLVPCVYNLWYQSTWPTLDREWLALRDACHQRMSDGDPDLFHHRTRWEDSFPLSDVIGYLVEVADQTPGFKHTESFLAALVHCFNELAESIWSTTYYGRFQRTDRRSNYFEQLHSELSDSDSCSLSTFLLHGGIYKLDQLSRANFVDYFKREEVKLRLFSTDQTIIFLHMVLRNHNSPALAQYCQELWARVLHLADQIAPLTPTITNGSKSVPVPAIIQRDMVLTMTRNNLTLDQSYLSIANILTTIFKLAASRHVSLNWTTGVLAHPAIAQVLDSLASRTDDYLRWAQIDTLTKQDILQNIDVQFIQLFKSISDDLDEERSKTVSGSQNVPLDVLFYLSSIFSLNLLFWSAPRKILGKQDSHFGQALRKLLDALHKTWTSGQKNDLLEEQFKGKNLGVHRFSDEWWNRIFEHISHPIIVHDADSDISSGLSISLEDDTEDATSPLPATSPNNLNHATASNMHDSNDPAASAHPDPPLEMSECEPASSTMDRADDSIPHSPSNSPTILHHPGATTKGTGTINEPPLSYPRSSSDGPDGTHSLGDDRTAAGAASTSISQPPPSPSAEDPDSVVPQQATRNGISDGDGDERQPGGLHLAIDVGLPTSLEEVGAEIPGAGGDHSLGEA